ncbi:hypothetical protein C8F04DRAFT_1195070 [Mycena alexandri]|uniref:Uncharacterized protein n=1 Tax=Mycena alexandri TaxID=1745969 RepID=A0AAD6S6L9_9AGAR|nr:hypothetical protein C8F04DRAFT_1195070 [Mycena alexandri]
MFKYISNLGQLYLEGQVSYISTKIDSHIFLGCSFGIVGHDERAPPFTVRRAERGECAYGGVVSVVVQPPDHRTGVWPCLAGPFGTMVTGPNARIATFLFSSAAVQCTMNLCRRDPEVRGRAGEGRRVWEMQDSWTEWDGASAFWIAHPIATMGDYTLPHIAPPSSAPRGTPPHRSAAPSRTCRATTHATEGPQIRAKPGLTLTITGGSAHPPCTFSTHRRACPRCAHVPTLPWASARVDVHPPTHVSRPPAMCAAVLIRRESAPTHTAAHTKPSLSLGASSVDCPHAIPDFALIPNLPASTPLRATVRSNLALSRQRQQTVMNSFFRR